MDGLDRDEAATMLRRMLRIRLFEEAAAELQASGEIPGPLHTSVGQEAAVVGACMALDDSDYMTGTHRSHGHPIGKGAQLGPLMAELMGKETGVCQGRGGSMHLADFSVGSLGESGVVGAGIPIALGAALSAKLRRTKQVSLSFFGDGGANTGPFHESMNLAAVWSLPMIFLCENNGYSATTRTRDMTSVEDIATRAIAYSMPGEVVDGMDVLAVREATGRAVARARAGEGPTLLDVKTYRFRDHAEFGRIRDTLQPYRSQEEVDEAMKRDPIVLFTARMHETGLLDAAATAALAEDVAAEIAASIEFARESAYPAIETLTDFLYTEPVAAHP